MRFKLGLCQMPGSNATDVAKDKRDNILKAEEMIRKAADEGCDIVALPDMWNTPYGNEYFRDYAESADGKTVGFMSGIAKELGIYLVGGTISEIDDDRIYNTCFVFDRKGELIGRHRKMHLFDIDVEGAVRFMESDTLTAGDQITVVDTEFGKIGIGICYDVRFQDMFMNMALKGVNTVFLPAAFTTTTGPLHWELLMRARAIDNEVYFAAVSPGRNPEGPYQAYGHTMLVDPWAKVIAEAGTGEEIVYGEVDCDYLETVRKQLPLLKHRRPEMYGK